jgi:hypothetical protein
MHPLARAHATEVVEKPIRLTVWEPLAKTHRLMARERMSRDVLRTVCQAADKGTYHGTVPNCVLYVWLYGLVMKADQDMAGFAS